MTAPGALVALAHAGAVWLETGADDALAEFLKLLIAERHDAHATGWWEGAHALKQASLDVGAVLDGRKLVTTLDDGRRARTRRAQLCDPAPRAGDFPGRAAISPATPLPDPYRCALCDEPVRPAQRTLESGFATVCQRCDAATATPGAGNHQRRGA